MAEPTAPAGGQYQEAIESYRRTAQWLLSAFGALGAALIAGAVPLSSLDEAGGWHKPVAIGCLAVALIAIVTVLASAVRLIAPSRGSYKDFGKDVFERLRKDLKRDPSPLAELATGAPELAGKYEEALHQEREAYDSYREDWLRLVAAAAGATSDVAEKDKATSEDAEGDETKSDAASTRPRPDLAALYSDAKERREELGEVVTRVEWLGLVLNAKARFFRFTLVLYAAIAVSAAATVAFFLIATPAHKTTPKPAVVKVSFTEPQTCAGLYLTLTELVQRAPRLPGHWPAAKPSAQMKKCGLTDQGEIAAFLTILSRR